MSNSIRVVERQRMLGAWMAVLGVALTIVADAFWAGPLAWALIVVGLSGILLGAWWTLSVAPVIVLWFPGGRPTVYRDGSVHARDLGAEGQREEARAVIRAVLWTDMGWFRATWSWLWARPRWRILVKIAAVHVLEVTDRGDVPFSYAMKEEARWLRRTVTAFMLNKRTGDCETELHDAVRGFLLVP